MNFNLIKSVIDLIHQFEIENEENNSYTNDVDGFKMWMVSNFKTGDIKNEPDWEGKAEGRSVESIIASHIVHMNSFGKAYFKSAIHGTPFSTQEDVIYMIVLKFGHNMTKMDLIKKNVSEKSFGMQIINRLISKGWVEQKVSSTDKRSKVLNLTSKGKKTLDDLFYKVRQATEIVSGNLTYSEKIELIRLLNKLNDFHQPIYDKNHQTSELLEAVIKGDK